MTKPFLWIVDHPVLTSLLIILATAWFAARLPDLKIDASAEVQMLQRDPDRAYYDAVKERFGEDKLTVILLRADNVFSTRVLRAIRDISAAVELLDGVKRVDSLSTVDQIKGDGEWLNIAPILDGGVPQDEAGVARARADALATPFFIDNLVADDSRTAAINVYLYPDAVGEAFNTKFTQQIESILKQATLPGVDAFQIGPPLIKVTVVDYVARDWAVLIPSGLLILFVILRFVFRAWHAVVIPIVTSAVSIVWALGIMAEMGYAINIVTSVIPSLLIIVGFTEDVHLISEFDNAREAGADKISALRTMMRAMGLAVVITSTTTVVGFASLSASSIQMFVEFGRLSAVSLAVNFIITIIVVPAMLRYWPFPASPTAQTYSRWGSRRFISDHLVNLGHKTIRRRPLTLATAGAVLVVSLLGVRGVRVDSGVLSHFKRDTPIIKRTHDLHETLAGGLSFYVVVDTQKQDGIKNPALLEQIEALQNFMADTGMVDKTVSVVDYIKKIHREMKNGASGHDSIPQSPELIAQYLLLLDSPEMSQLVDRNYSAANIVVRHNVINAWELSAFLDKLQAYIDEHFENPIHVKYTGEDILLNNAAKQLAVTMVTGLSYTLFVVALINVLLFKSLAVGLVALVPNLIPVVSYLGFMGFFDIPLNTGTAMIAPIAVGIAVDDTVHYMVRYRQEYRKLGDVQLATTTTLRSEGPAIVTTSVGLAAGFLVLLFSNFVTFSYFGVLASFVMIIALLADLLVTPALMSIVKV